MPFASDLLIEYARMPPAAVRHLQLLGEDWQIVADLSFADLLLLVPHERPDGTQGFLTVGQMRPYTAQTIYVEDLVGRIFGADERPMVARALAEARVIRDADPDWSTGVPVREEAIPVRWGDELIGVVTREANVSTARAPSQLELAYLQSAGELATMIMQGTFPYFADETAGEHFMSPRVGDGIMRLDPSGTVVYASPNAISCYRRLGYLDHVVGRAVEEFDPAAGVLLDALADARPVESEVEGNGAVVVRRLLPLIVDSEVVAALLLAREVTELRRQERALRVKDATIREVHHRVKNNLQTVASLLRLQARRLHGGEAKAALAESVRRITSIALVHETLSEESHQRVDFRQVTDRIVRMLGDGLVSPEVPISFQVLGDAGELPAEVATPLALVITELLQNAVEHGYPAHADGTGAGGTVTVRFDRAASTLAVGVADDGVGLPEHATLSGMANLGLQIVRTLVESELGGTFRVTGRTGVGGAAFELVLPLP